jgi:hypothetical protein
MRNIIRLLRRLFPCPVLNFPPMPEKAAVLTGLTMRQFDVGYRTWR